MEEKVVFLDQDMQPCLKHFIFHFFARVGELGEEERRLDE